MEKVICKNVHFGILGVFTLLNILFSSFFFISGSKVGLGVVLLLQLLYLVLLLFVKVENDGSTFSKMNIAAFYVYFIMVFWAATSFLRGSELGWKWSLLEAAIVGCIVCFFLLRKFK